MARKRRNRAKQRRADARAVRDGGPDESGRYGISSYAARGHVVETAPRELRSNPDSQYPKRITTQRILDRYLSGGLITEKQWKAGDRVWQLYVATGLMPNLTASYSPVFVDNVGDPEKRMIGREDATLQLMKTMTNIGGMGASCARFVIIEDGSAADWAKTKGCGNRTCGSVGMFVLRGALDDLIRIFGY